MNIYETHHRSSCPNGALLDAYEITIKSHHVIMVETINEVLASVKDCIFQEDLATVLRSKLGAEITVIGWHHGIKITTIRN